jgi:hypothetical protein
MRHVATNAWTREDIEKLRLWHSAGVSRNAIATRLGRSKSSVNTKIRALRLPRRAVPTPVAVPRDPQPPERAGAVTLPRSNL